jgi:predicted short-subunit dehydrogenase-like oxidoreductase (DUF2520 family)
VSRPKTRAEFEVYAADSDRAAARFDEAAVDADQAALTEIDPDLSVQYEAIGKLHRQHAAEAREDARTYREGRIPGVDS